MTAVAQLAEDLASMNVPSAPALTPVLLHLAQEIDAATFVNGGTIPVTPGTNPLVINGNTNATSPNGLHTLTLLQVIGSDGHNARVSLDAFGGAALFTAGAAGGTFLSPTGVNTGVNIGGIVGLGFDGTAYATFGGGVTIESSESFSAGHHGVQLNFAVVANATTTQSTAMVLQNSGALTVGATTDASNGKLQVTGTAAIDDLLLTGSVVSMSSVGTVDPHVAGQLWFNSGVATRSAG